MRQRPLQIEIWQPGSVDIRCCSPMCASLAVSLAVHRPPSRSWRPACDYGCRRERLAKMNDARTSAPNAHGIRRNAVPVGARTPNGA